MRKLALPLLVVLLCVAGCKKELNPMQSAEKYYGYLVKGDVDGYMRGMVDYDSLPDDYRQQLRDLYLQYLDREQQQRGGIVAARALRDTLVDDSHAHVFLELAFADSTREQVSLPLVLTSDGWRLR